MTPKGHFEINGPLFVTSLLQKRKSCHLTVFSEGFAAPVLSARDSDIWKPSLKIFPREVKEARTTHRDGQWNEILSVCKCRFSYGICSSNFWVILYVLY